MTTTDTVRVFTAEEARQAADLGEHLIHRMMERSSQLRYCADTCWDTHPDRADDLDRQEVALRLEAAAMERAVAELKALAKKPGPYEVTEVRPDDDSDLCPLPPI
jgi:hypothetical protein